MAAIAWYKLCDHVYDCEYYHGIETGHYLVWDDCGCYDEDSFEPHVNDDNDDYCDYCDYEVGHTHTYDEGCYYGVEEGHYVECDQCG